MVQVHQVISSGHRGGSVRRRAYIPVLVSERHLDARIAAGPFLERARDRGGGAGVIRYAQLPVLIELVGYAPYCFIQEIGGGVGHRHYYAQQKRAAETP